MPEFRLEDTIAAVATPLGEGGISVIRVSGPDALTVVGNIFRLRKSVGAGSPRPQQGAAITPLHTLPSHTIHVGEIRNEKGEALDQVLASLFRAPHSYTGEEVIEISSHGGMAVTRRILDLLIRQGARHAEPGEFTRRAFLNGKIDLTQAEAVLDLIKAKSERSLQVAARQLAGALSEKFRGLKEELMFLYAHMEAALDFPDEHLEVYSDGEFAERFSRLRVAIHELLASFKRGSILREGIRVVIVGKPNVGKSSLFNALLERDRALVSEYPGTTRDQLEETIEIVGLSVRLIDTAGLVPASDHPLERISVQRTYQMLQEGGLFLYLVDGSAPLDEADRLVFEELRQAAGRGEPESRPILVGVNKADLPEQLDRAKLEALTGETQFLTISTRTREGMDQLERQIADKISVGDAGEGEQITRLRHKHALAEALAALDRAEEAFQRKESLELVVLDLKTALDRLRELIGEIYSEDLLDVIFSEFCIGK